MAAKRKPTLIAVIVDESGSMATIRKDAEGGYAAFLEEQQKVPGKCKIIRFHFAWNYMDMRWERAHELVDIKDAPEMVLHPNGGTPLLDAVGRGIGEVEKLAGDQRIIVVVITDGQENSSRKFTNAALQALTEQKIADGWNFIYLGANQDAFAAARAMGFDERSTSNYAPTAKGVAASYFAASAAVSRGRVSGQSVSFTEAERTSMTEDES